MPWLLGLLALAAVHFGRGIGEGSFFVDEIFSVEIGQRSLGAINEGIRATERIPPLHYFGLHEWMGHFGSPSEAGARASSVIGGVLLVGAVFWMAGAFVSRKQALVAAGLCAASPLVLQYAQQVRAYVWVMLAVTVAVGATVRGGRWLWIGGVAAVAALWLHYMALLVVVPLCLWLLRERGRAAAGYVVACVIAQVALVPLMVDQFADGAGTGGLAQGAFSASSVGRVLGTPFDGRWASGLDWPQLVGALATVVAVAWIWRRSRLLAVLAATAPLALAAGALAGSDLLLSRYATVAAPMMLVAIAAAPRPVLVLAVAATAGGLVLSHGNSGRYAPLREAVTVIQDGYEPGDAVVLDPNPAITVPAGYYIGRLLSPRPELRPVGAPLEGRTWIVAEVKDGDPRRRPVLHDLDHGLHSARVVRHLTWLTPSQIFLTATTRSSLTSTRRRCACTTTSTTRLTWTRPTVPSRAPSGPTRTSRRCLRTSTRCPPTSRVPSATTPAAITTTRCSGSR